YQRKLNVVDGGPDRRGTIIDNGEFCAGRHRAAQARQLVVDTLDRFDHIGARLTLHVDYDRRLAPVPGADLGIFQPVDDVGDVADLDRRAVAERHNDFLVGIDGGDLVVGGNGVGLMGAVE